MEPNAMKHMKRYNFTMVEKQMILYSQKPESKTMTKNIVFHKYISFFFIPF